MKQYFTGFFTAVCLTASVFIFMGSQNTSLANKKLIEENTDSLVSMIDDVSFTLDNFMRTTDKKFRNVTNDLEDLALEMKRTVRKLKQGISDLEQVQSNHLKTLH